MPPPGPGRVVGDYVLQYHRGVIRLHAHPAAVVVGNIPLNQIALNEGAAEISGRDSPTVTARADAVVRDRIPDNLGRGGIGIAPVDKDPTAAFAAIPGALIVRGDYVVLDRGRAAVHIDANSDSGMISGNHISCDGR